MHFFRSVTAVQSARQFRMVFMPDGDPVCLKQCRCHTVAGFQYAVKCTIVNHAAAAGRTVGFQDHMCDIALLQMLQCPQCALFKGISDIFAVTAGNPAVPAQTSQPSPPVISAGARGTGRPPRISGHTGTAIPLFCSAFSGAYNLWLPS